MNTPASVQSQKDVGLPRRLRPGSRSLTERAIPRFEDIQSELTQNCGSHERVRLTQGTASANPRVRRRSRESFAEA
jgi:hypothetical protein